jgi:hypothetical protein
MWDWDFTTLSEIAKQPAKKYIITDDLNEFLERVDIIAENGLKKTGDNLRYLELKEKIKLVRNGAKIEDAYKFLGE